MVIGMKTTLNLNEGLLRRAKARAAEAGMTLTAVIEDALRVALEAEPPTSYRFTMPVVEGELGIPIDDREAMYDWFDQHP